ncbi:hypothetical protein D3C75_516620 [compost metagenome]
MGHICQTVQIVLQIAVPVRTDGFAVRFVQLIQAIGLFPGIRHAVMIAVQRSFSRL